jgi:holliday junction DNA helicase RuvA
MLDFLRGRMVRRSPMEVILDVGGVGFRVVVPMSTSSALAQSDPAANVELLTHLQITTSDPHVRLFGFYTEIERRMFELLTSVKGVGPGMAVRVLSGASVEELRDAILTQDLARLTRVKGIGKKTAERILFDLREKVLLLGDGPLDLRGVLGGSGTSEALVAMTALGYDGREAKKAVDKAIKKLGDSASSEDLVRQALAEIS